MDSPSMLSCLLSQTLEKPAVASMRSGEFYIKGNSLQAVFNPKRPYRGSRTGISNTVRVGQLSDTESDYNSSVNSQLVSRCLVCVVVPPPPLHYYSLCLASCFSQNQHSISSCLMLCTTCNKGQLQTVS